MLTTRALGLRKPEDADSFGQDDFNFNSDQLDKFVRLAVNVKGFGAVGDGVVDDTAAVLAAIAATRFTIMGGTQTLRRPLYFPAGRYVISATLSSVAFAGDDYRWFGDGETLTYLTLKDGVNVPLVSNAVISHKFWIAHMTLGCWNTAGRATHTANAFPMLDMSAAYISTFQNVTITNCPGDGVKIGNGSVAPPADAISFLDCMITNNLGSGIYNDRSESMKIIGGAIESNTLYDVYVKGNPVVTYDHGIISGCRFEEQAGGAGVFLERATGYLITGNYFNGGIGVCLDENSHGNQVVGNQFLSGATLHDGGFLNLTAPNDGVFNPLTRPSHLHFPASRLSDGDGTAVGAGFWTGQARGGGGGSLSKDVPLGLLTESPGSEDLAGRGAPLRIVPAGAAGYSAYQDVAVSPGDSFLFEVYWTSEARPTDTFQLQLTNVAGTVVYYDSGPLTKPFEPATSSWRLGRASVVFQIPAGVVTLRVLLSATFSAPVYLDRVNMIKLASNNGGFDGAYTAGIAPGWGLNQSGGSPVMAQELALIRPAMVGHAIPTGNATMAAQKLSVPDNASYVELLTTPTLDSARLYFLRGYIYVASGPPAAAQISWGGGAYGGQVYRFRLHPSTIGRWEAVTRVFRPAATNAFNNHLMLTLQSGAPVTAYFDDVAVCPLRELLSEKTAVADEITLSAAAFSQAVIVPSIDSVLRRITVVYTVATDANAGVALNVGTYAAAAYYGTLTSAINTAQGTQTEFTLTKTDLVAGRPVVVSCPGGKTGVGKVQIALEYE